MAPLMLLAPCPPNWGDIPTHLQVRTLRLREGGCLSRVSALAGPKGCRLTQLQETWQTPGWMLAHFSYKGL